LTQTAALELHRRNRGATFLGSDLMHLLGVTPSWGQGHTFLGSDLTLKRCPSAHLWGLVITHPCAQLRCGAASSWSFLLPYRGNAGAKRASLGHRGHLSCFPGRMAAPSGIRGSFNEPPRRLCALRRSGVCRPSACFTAFSCPCTRLISRSTTRHLCVSGFINAAKRVLNVDQAAVLVLDETAGTVELNWEWLARQFRVTVR